MESAGFLVGCGRSDITGESAECGLLGYGKATQRSAGIHLPLWARAFVFGTAAAPDARVLIVVAELGLMFASVRDAVLAGLQRRFGDRYNATNTMITATHTHCGPGGYSHHVMYNSTTRGFRPTTFAAIVDGMVESVERADADVAPAEVRLTRGRLCDASTNRSPTAFARNPESDRAHFPDGIDSLTTLLRIERDGDLVGAVNFFATHGTSMTNRNRLISPDNKGHAAIRWERAHAGGPIAGGPDAGSAPPVLAFAQTNSGDMSPNLHRRPGDGPTPDEFANAEIIGARQADAAARLARQAAAAMPARVAAAALHAGLARVAVSGQFTPDGRPRRTGQACAGTSSLAGAWSDGKGFARFREGGGRRLDRLFATTVYRFRPGLAATQAPKTVALSGGALNRRIPFVAESGDFQLLRIGDLHLLAVPLEVTIVAGLRLRRTVADVLGVGLDDVLVCGYSNGYLHYLTTPEEYLDQQYEGGSTLFGRWELPAVMQVAHRLAAALAADDASGGAVTRLAAVPAARPVSASDRGRFGSYRIRADRGDGPTGASGFGVVLRPPRTRYRPGDRAIVEFRSGNPNNAVHCRAGGSQVERLDGTRWDPVAGDSDPETMLRWRRSRGASIASICWQIPINVTPGRYRIRHRAQARTDAGRLVRIDIHTDSFEVGTGEPT